MMLMRSDKEEWQACSVVVGMFWAWAYEGPSFWEHSNAWGMLSYKVTQGQGPRTPMSVMQLRVAVDVPTHTAKLGPSVATTSAG